MIEGASRRLFGYNAGLVGQRLDALEKRLAILEEKSGPLSRQISLLGRILRDEQLLWLYQNRSERMDASEEIFDETRRAFHLARYEFACDYVAGKDVADIACGTGYGSELLRLEGNAKSVIGVDIDQRAIEYAAARHEAEGCEYRCAPGTATGLPADSVDVVVSFETLEHVPDDQALIAEFVRILQPAGVLVCSVPNKWPLEGAPHHVRVYDMTSFRTLLNREFEEVELYNQNSGSDRIYNHGQPAGIIPTTPQNAELAECYVAICRRPK